ncbi:Hsp20/alpha crystallin family protein [Paenibacillus sp. P25]|nr:Hsp20/alpha crystallin family protein [Paenibacillus sp. P25]
MEDKQKNNPFMEWNTLQTQVGGVLGEDFWQDIAKILPNSGPRVDIYYTSNTVVVLAELPGLNDPNLIDIRLQGQTLVIEGELPRLYPAPDNRITQQERFFGSFHRESPMPKPVSSDGIQAKYRQGLLIVELQIGQTEPSNQVPIDFEP